MNLDDEAIEEFKNIYIRLYGQEISDQEAIELGTSLIRFVKAVYVDDLPKLKKLNTSIKGGE